jgi:hypothetical protein
MQDEEKTKDQLVNELRQRIDDLEALEAEHREPISVKGCSEDV